MTTPGATLETVLDEIRGHLAAVKEIRASWTPRGESVGSGMAGEWVIANLEVASDTPRLLAALDAALAVHKPYERMGDQFCERCIQATGRRVWRTHWPCSTVRAISAALLGDLS